MVRIAHDPETTHYFERRVKEGRTKRDVIRILQRYIAREPAVARIKRLYQASGLVHEIRSAKG
jgi:hypothetical protein